MATKTSKPSVDVPVKIVGQTIPPTSARRVVIPAVTKKPTPPTPTKISTPARQKTELPESVRRRWMWALVAVCAIVLIVAWLPLAWRSGGSGGFSFGNTWNSIKKTFTSYSFKKSTATAAEQEIRTLDSEVFPELSQ